MDRILDTALVAASLTAGAALTHLYYTTNERPNCHEPQPYQTLQAPPQPLPNGIPTPAFHPEAGPTSRPLERLPHPTQANHRPLFNAICAVESRGDPNAVGDGGKAVGIAQIWPIMVEDCNRIVGHQKWTLADRLDPTATFNPQPSRTGQKYERNSTNETDM